VPVISLDELVARVPDGALLALPSDRRGVAMAATRALLRRRPRGLRLFNMPTGGLQTDLLVGAGAVATVETSGVSLGEFGGAPRFARAVTSGAVAIRDATCPAIHAQLQAAEKGVPFLPIRGLIGSDVLRYRADWKVIDNPMVDGGDPLVLLPAVKPDIALFHVSLADRQGNVWVGRERDLVTLAHASRETLVTAEEIHDGSLYDDDRLAAGALSNFYVTAVAEARHGAWPLAQPGLYEDDAAAIAGYARAAKTDDGFAAWLAEHVFATKVAAQ
jgi:glutaconate CoA-transferase subunit A